MNPSYADVRYESGREATVSIRDVSSCHQTLRRNNDSQMRVESKLTTNDVESATDVNSNNI